MTNNNSTQSKFKKGVLFFLLFSFVFSFSFFPTKAQAFSDIIGGPVAVVRKVTDWVEKNKDKFLVKMGANMFQSALKSSLFTLAYDGAVYLGTGIGGQKPTWETDYWTKYGDNIRDAAIGEALDLLGEEWDFNFCEPNINIKTKIGLGLTHNYRPVEPSCGWQQMKDGWKSEFDRWESYAKDPKKFLDQIVASIDPAASDIGITMSLLDKILEKGNEEKEKVETQLTFNKGWLDVRSIGGKQESVPGAIEGEVDQTRDLATKTFGQTTGDIFVDAVNIFSNQLLLSTINSLLKSYSEGSYSWFGEDEVTSPFGYSDVASSEVDPSSLYTRAGLSETLKKVLTPKFTEKTDYSILAELMICNSENNYSGPNNCVIGQSFGRAIENKNTLIEAIEGGSISAGLLFSEKGDYQRTLNRRSLMILRKFRIVPIAWEEALNRITPLQKSNSGQYTIMDMLSCFSDDDEYNQFSKNFPHDPNNASEMTWCRGLVDPHWVLKAPMNYCARQGYGGHILSTQTISTPETKDGDGNIISEGSEEILVVRSDSYCADERSCVKEAGDGSCQFYGYCTEEKRTWNFNSDSCPAVFNTCESFKNYSGKKLALLKNTIQYSPCDASNAGCSIYSTFGSYDIKNAKVFWNSDNLINLNRKAENCSSGSEGCNEFIRTKSGFGHNFITNGNFESDEGWESYFSEGKIKDSVGYDGSRGLVLESGDVLSGLASIGPDNNFLKGETFTLSFYAKCTATSTASIADMSVADYKTIPPSNDFSYQSVSYSYSDSQIGSDVVFKINVGSNTQCSFDQLKLEKGAVGTFYSDYRGDGLVYIKTIPDYLKEACYTDPYSTTNPNFTLKSNAPAECYRYARLCNFNELGCDLFKMADGRNIPAKAMDKDYCPAECDGYNVYIQKSTIFESDSPHRLIPTTAKKCSANSAGCTEFTNLEDLSSGGERVEYYSYLRQCIKPNEGTCSSFYSWEGNDESGYQLRSFNLSIKNSQPSLTEGNLFSDGGSYKHIIGGVDVCSSEIIKLNPSNPRYSSDCREMYNQAGDIFYVLYSKTITCSDKCTLYRMTERNINKDITEATECSNLNASGKVVAKWATATVDDYEISDSVDGFVCFHCLNGGIWDEGQQACVYKAIPGEGKSCSSSENYCREYGGNTASNVRIVTSYDFEQDVSGWQGGVSSETSLSNNGRSMRINPSSESNRSISGLVKGRPYLLSFLARNHGKNTDKNIDISSDLEIYFINSKGDISNFKTISPVNGESVNNISIKGSAWQVYRISLDELNHDIDSGEKIVIKNTSTNIVYIDDLILSESANRYYLIKNSWKTPNICYYDQTSKYQGANYNLGCSAYLDRSNNKHYLRQFTKLCDESAVGCELMIDTHNSTPKESNLFLSGNLGNDLKSCPVDSKDCVQIPRDNFSLVVYDNAKICNAADKGCSLLGKAVSNVYSLSSSYVYQNIYLKNNPDKYDQGILCAEEAIGCDSWSSSAGDSYFKDPMDNVCQLVDNKWYVKKVKRCLLPNQIFGADMPISSLPDPCNSDSDCLNGRVCKLDETNYLCSVDSNYGIIKTIGNEGALVSQPYYETVGLPNHQTGSVNWSGLCPLKDSGCTEYIDPESSFNPNLISNPNFSDIDDDGVYFDGWSPVAANGTINVSGQQCSVNNNDQISCTQTSSSYYFKQSNYFLEPNKLYSVEYKNIRSLRIKCENPFYELNSANILNFIPGSSFYSIQPLAQYSPIYASKFIFYSANNLSNDCELVIEISPTTRINDISLEWRELIVDYKIKNNLDFSTCNFPEFNRGCILFNERTVLGDYPNYSGLTYDSSNYDKYNPSKDSDYKDANKIIKVSPDRVCGKWLSCYSYTTEKDEKGNDKNVCLQIGQCTSMDSSGNCLNFSKSIPGNRGFDSAKDANVSGYSLLNHYYFDAMIQRGNSSVFENDFENSPDLISWQDDSGSAVAGSCLISKSSDTLGENARPSRPVYPSPSNLGFVRVGGNSCEWNWYSDQIETSIQTDYFINFLINTANLSYPQQDTDKISLGKIIGLDLNDEETDLNAVDLMVDVSKKDWQRVTLKFRTDSSWVGGSKIILGPSDSGIDGWMYIDDINIEPVLEAGEENYIPASCRLYPRQNSIACSSDAKGYSFVEQGWEGYCLEKDPLNENVCLMWYPVDSVVGSSGALSTNFSGYPSTGSNPSYCARMNAKFDLVEYRDVFFADQEDDDIGYHSRHWYSCNDSCDNSTYNRKFISIANSSVVNYPDINYNVYESKGKYSSTTSGVTRSDVRDCIDDFDYPDGGNIACSWERCAWVSFQWMEPRSDLLNNRIISVVGNSIHSQSLISNRNANRGTCDGPAYGSYPVTLDPYTPNGARCNDHFECSNTSKHLVPSVGAGWYKSDGIHSMNSSNPESPEIKNGLKILAYNLTERECDSGIYGDNTEFFPTGSGNDSCPLSKCTAGFGGEGDLRNGACLMDPDKYTPKCDVIVQGNVAWVDRLKSSSYSLKEYVTSLPGYFADYTLGSRNAPFGAINSIGSPLFDVYVNKVSEVPAYALHGLPYSCSGLDGAVYTGAGYINSCNSLYYDVAAQKVKFSNNIYESPTKRYSNNLNNYNSITATALKNIFAEVNYLNYSHLSTADDDPPLQEPADPCGDGCPPRENDKTLCAIYPQIKNVKMSGPNGPINQIDNGDGIPSNIYNIVAGGFYTLSFNTFVDGEQGPIKKLYIKIKKVDEDWSQNSIVLSNIDHRPDQSNPHRLVKFLSPGQYMVLIKVIDNWDFFKCAGMGVFAKTSDSCYQNCCGSVDSDYFENPFSPACDSPTCVDGDIKGSLPTCN